MLRSLERDLGQTHRLVRWVGSVSAPSDVPSGARKLERFRFRHALFQQHCYAALGAVERRLRHGDIAAALEACYGKTDEAWAAALGWHWEQAGEGARAVPCLLAAGDRARLAYANADAIGFCERALALQRALGDDEAAARTLMRLGLIHSAAAQFEQAERVYAEGTALWRQAMSRPRPAAQLPPAPHPLRLHWYWGHSVRHFEMSPSAWQFQLYAGLVEETPALEVVPDVAEGWDISADGRTYTFYLRRDACWSDGAPVTADDFVYAWRWAFRPGVTDETADLFDDIRGARAFHRGETTNPDELGVRAIDPHTLRVELERPAPYFLHIIATVAAMPTPQHLGERGLTLDSRLVCNGPFVVESVRPGELVVLRRNPCYAGRFTGNVERVEISQRLADTEWEAMLELFRSDRLDSLFVSNFPLEADIAVGRWHAGGVLPVATTSTMGDVFDTTRPPFDDVRVRRAIQMGVDLARHFNELRPGRQMPATGGLLPPGMPGHSPDLAPRFAPAEARRLLAEAGYPDGRGFPPTTAVGVDSPVAASYVDVDAGAAPAEPGDRMGRHLSAHS